MDPDVNEAGAGGRWWVRAVRGTGSWVVPWRGGPCRPAPRPARAAGPPARPRGERPRPWFRAAATPVTGAAGPPTPNLTGQLPVSVAALGARPGVGRAVSVPQVKPAPGAGGSPAAPSPAPRTASAASSPLTGRQSATPAGARRPRSTWTPGQGPVPGPGRLPADRLAVGQRRRISWAGLGPWRRGGSPGSAGGRRRRPAGAKLGVVGHVRRGPHRRHRRPGPPWGPGARRGPAAGRRAR
jgi:translation initiation factor IF-2